MAKIEIASEYRRLVVEEHRKWGSNLPRSPGQIGSGLTQLVEGNGSTSDTTVFYYVPQEVIDVLRRNKVPIKVL